MKKNSEEVVRARFLNHIFEALTLGSEKNETVLQNVFQLIESVNHWKAFIYQEKPDEFLLGTKSNADFKQNILNKLKTMDKIAFDEEKNGKYVFWFPIHTSLEHYGWLAIESEEKISDSWWFYLKLTSDILANFFEKQKMARDYELANRKYQIVLDNSLSGVYLIQNGVFKYANQALLNILGYSLEELMQIRILLRFVRKDFHAVIVNDIRDILAGRKKTATASVKVYRKDGQEIWGQYHAVAIEYEGRRAILGYLMDITEDVELGKQEEKIMKLMLNEQKMKTFQNLVSGIAHEFNNLFTIIQGTAELMEYGIDQDSPLSGRIKEILTAVKRGSNITNRMRVFVRHDKMQIRTIFLEQFFEDSMPLFKEHISKSGKKIRLSYEVDPTAPCIIADDFSLEEILFNLIQNSIAAIPQEGSIVIRVWLLKSGEIEIEVVDDGIGIDPQNIEKVFDPFFTTKAPNEGTGLGLFIVYQLMEAMNGRVQIEALPQKGTRVSLIFPAYTTD